MEIRAPANGIAVNVALPHMQGSLTATQEQISWVLTSYIVASAIMTLPTAWLAGRFGRKRVFLVAVGGFTLTSVLCGMATSIEQMLLFRILQGCFGLGFIFVPLSTVAYATLPTQYRAEGPVSLVWFAIWVAVWGYLW